ncbi:MAG: 8-amino-7-oxononanoate synthase, partial [Spongiibacteraceae bacterium]|nr:8-amino-7-oxononanoate synthase [Spongiibacteraceae bacterium]
ILHHQLEERIAAFTGRPRALLFSTGYMANLGVITALVGRGDYVFEDRLNHASLLDGGLLSGARFQRFAHNDPDALERGLAKAESGRKLVVVDGVFSMDGDIAPLPELAAVAARRDAWLMVDDAHGFGVLGANGAGSVAHFGLTAAQVPVLMGTLGKSAGVFGAFVAGSETLIETLIQFARPYIYTTALPPMVAGATLAAIDLVEREAWRRDHLRALISHWRSGAKSLGLPVLDSDTAIQPLLAGDAAQALAISAALAERGLWVTAIRPPTVPAGTARLRVTLTAAHSVAQVDRLLEALAEVWPLS